MTSQCRELVFKNVVTDTLLYQVLVSFLSWLTFIPFFILIEEKSIEEKDRELREKEETSRRIKKIIKGDSNAMAALQTEIESPQVRNQCFSNLLFVFFFSFFFFFSRTVTNYEATFFISLNKIKEVFENMLCFSWWKACFISLSLSFSLFSSEID